MLSRKRPTGERERERRRRQLLEESMPVFSEMVTATLSPTSSSSTRTERQGYSSPIRVFYSRKFLQHKGAAVRHLLFEARVTIAPMSSPKFEMYTDTCMSLRTNVVDLRDRSLASMVKLEERKIIPTLSLMEMKVMLMITPM